MYSFIEKTTAFGVAFILSGAPAALLSNDNCADLPGRGCNMAAVTVASSAASLGPAWTISVPVTITGDEITFTIEQRYIIGGVPTDVSSASAWR